MAFRTDKEHSKWDQIQKAGSVPLDKILKGEALPSDIKALSDLIGKQHSEASKVFEAGVQGAEATADAIIDKMNKERIELGKRPLTQKAQERLFKQTFQRVLSASAEDIIGSIHDLLDEKFEKFSEDSEQQTKSLLESAFEKLAAAKAAVKDKKTDESEDNRNKQHRVWSKRPASSESSTNSNVIDKVTALTKKVDAVKEVADKTLRHAKKAEELGDEFSEPTPPVSIGPASSLIGKLRDKLLGKRVLYDRDEDQFHSMQSLLEKYNVRKDRDVKADVKAQYKADPTLKSKFPLGVAINQALKQNSEAKRKAENHWKELKSSYSGDDDKEATSWFRRIKDKLGLGKHHDRETDSGNWIGTLGKVLLLTLLNPELLVTISKQIAKYLNFDTISDFLTSSLKDIKDGGSKTMDWIIEKIKNFFHPDTKVAVPKTSEDVAKVQASVQRESAIPKNTTPGKAAEAIRDLEPRIEQTKRKLVVAQAAAAKNPTSDNQMVVSHLSQRLAILQNQLTGYKTVIPGSSTYGKQPQQVTAAVGPSTNGGVTPMTIDTSSPASFQKPSTVDKTSGLASFQKPVTVGNTSVPTAKASSVSSASSIDPTTILNNSSARPQVQSAAPITYKDGVIIPAPQNSSSGKSDTQTSSSATTTNTVSISSFGFGSGDDTLNILNLGLMA